MVVSQALVQGPDYAYSFAWIFVGDPLRSLPLFTSIGDGADLTSQGGFSIVLSPLALNVTVTLAECTSIEIETSLGTNIAPRAFDISVYMTSE